MSRLIAIFTNNNISYCHLESLLINNMYKIVKINNIKKKFKLIIKNKIIGNEANIASIKFELNRENYLLINVEDDFYLHRKHFYH